MTVHRIFYIDTGKRPPKAAMAHLEKVKEDFKKELAGSGVDYIDYYMPSNENKIEIIETNKRG